MGSARRNSEAKRFTRNFKERKNREKRLKKELNTTVSRPRLEDLPDVLTVKDLRALLPIGKNAIYEALHDQRIRNVRVRQKILIPKTAVREFLGHPVECAVESGPCSEE